MSHSEAHSSTIPAPISSRGSIRPDSRPPSIIDAIVPMPRGAITSPAVATG